jgi:hypothetical protein
MEATVTTGSSKHGFWQEIARKIAVFWQGPLPRRPASRDPREIDEFYVLRYAPRRSRATSRSHETA